MTQRHDWLIHTPITHFWGIRVKGFGLGEGQWDSACECWNRTERESHELMTSRVLGSPGLSAESGWMALAKLTPFYRHRHAENDHTPFHKILNAILTQSIVPVYQNYITWSKLSESCSWSTCHLVYHAHSLTDFFFLFRLQTGIVALAKHWSCRQSSNPSLIP